LGQVELSGIHSIVEERREKKLRKSIDTEHSGI
jgi:hypothetical protein